MRFTCFPICAAMLVLATAVSCPCVNGQVRTTTSEPELIAIMSSGDTSDEDKALACKRLAIYGSAAAVPELAKLLPDYRFASWARIALEAIPARECDEALRSATKQLDGNLLIGVVNSIGVRRDRESVETLTELLKNPTFDIASAAAVALGKIGDETAAGVLRQSLSQASVEVRSAIAEGCVLCAERILATGNRSLAIEMYDEVRNAKVPMQRIVEATRGAIIARGAEGVPVLVEQIRSPERSMFQLALQVARESQSKEVGKALLSEINSATTDRATLIVHALGDLPNTVEQQSIIDIAANAKKEVRVAAIGVLGRIGDAACVAPLLKIAMESEDLQAPVRAALVDLQDESVNGEILKRLKTAKDETQLLIEVVGLRRIEATAQLETALSSSQAAVRGAALASLGSIVPQDRLSILISQVVAPKYAEDLTAAQKALKEAAVRMPDREACAAELTIASKKAALPTRLALMEILGSVGGPTSLETVAAVAKESDPQLKDVSTRLLGEWMTIDAAPVLLDLAKRGPADKFQLRAVKGYIRIARQFVMSDQERIAMCENAMEAAKQTAEKKMVVEIFSRYPSIGMLKLAVEAAKSPALKEDANRAALTIAEKLKDNTEAQELARKAGILP